MRTALIALAIAIASPAAAGEGFPDDVGAASNGDEPAPPATPPATVETPAPAPPGDPAPTPAAAPAAYRLVPGRSKLYARVYKAGAAAAFAHDHVITARETSGSARIDPAAPERSSVEISVSVTGLFPDSDEMRAYVGLPNTLSDKQRAEILDHLLDEGQLFADKYDKIAFRSTAISATGETWSVTGDFTLRGVTHSVTVPMTVTAQGGDYRAVGQFRILQSDYGYRPYKTLLGAIQNEDPVDIVIEATLSPK